MSRDIMPILSLRQKIAGYIGHPLDEDKVGEQMAMPKKGDNSFKGSKPCAEGSHWWVSRNTPLNRQIVYLPARTLSVF